MSESIRIDGESDEWEVTRIEAIPPTWRDVWSIIRGTYRPQLIRVKRATPKAIDRAFREVWTADHLMDDLYAGDVLLEKMQGKESGTVPIHRRAP